MSVWPTVSMALATEESTTVREATPKSVLESSDGSFPLVAGGDSADRHRERNEHHSDRLTYPRHSLD
jgi:hypothetical protein